MFCKECGYEINGNELNCPVCGAKVLQVKNTKVDKLEEYGRRFLAGDMNAYNDIYMNTEKWLRSMLYHRINKEEVENCMQEIYLKLYRNISYFNPDKGSFRAWFNRVAENCANDYRDKVNNYAKHINDSYMVADEEGFSEMEIPDFSYSPDAYFSESEVSTIVNEILGEISEDQRKCLMLYHVDRYSYKEIANILNIPEGTVKSRINSGRAKVEKKVNALSAQGIKLFSLAPFTFFVWLIRYYDGAALTVTGQLQGAVGTGIAAGTAGGAGMLGVNQAGTGMAGAGVAGANMAGTGTAGGASYGVAGANVASTGTAGGASYGVAGANVAGTGTAGGASYGVAGANMAGTGTNAAEAGKASQGVKAAKAAKAAATTTGKSLGAKIAIVATSVVIAGGSIAAAVIGINNHNKKKEQVVAEATTVAFGITEEETTEVGEEETTELTTEATTEAMTPEMERECAYYDKLQEYMGMYPTQYAEVVADSGYNKMSFTSGIDNLCVFETDDSELMALTYSEGEKKKRKLVIFDYIDGAVKEVYSSEFEFYVDDEPYIVEREGKTYLQLQNNEELYENNGDYSGHIHTLTEYTYANGQFTAVNEYKIEYFVFRADNGAMLDGLKSVNLNGNAILTDICGDAYDTEYTELLYGKRICNFAKTAFEWSLNNENGYEKHESYRKLKSAKEGSEFLDAGAYGFKLEGNTLTNDYQETFTLINGGTIYSDRVMLTKASENSETIYYIENGNMDNVAFSFTIGSYGKFRTEVHEDVCERIGLSEGDCVDIETIKNAVCK